MKKYFGLASDKFELNLFGSQVYERIAIMVMHYNRISSRLVRIYSSGDSQIETNQMTLQINLGLIRIGF